MSDRRPVARLMREIDGRLEPVGDPLPPFDHAPPSPNREMAPWILPRELATRPGDLVVIGEVAHRMLAPMPPDDPAVQDLWDQTALLHGVEATRAWFAEVEVWLGMKLPR